MPQYVYVEVSFVDPVMHAVIYEGFERYGLKVIQMGLCGTISSKSSTSAMKNSKIPAVHWNEVQ